MITNQVQIWTVIAGLGIGTLFIRYSFLGLLGNRELPEWFLRHLRYVGVAILPGLIAPLILWPEATGGSPDASRILATIAAITIGVWKRSVVGTVVAGFGVLYAVQYFTG
ncbi:AzlD domain-containing protein [Amylibacter sp. SFDW26]|uniref:AzlD domain-containing protein n=1 Tax=Amylibacter sp. SFDW26 TaxID=2652722 RepID=UPI001D02BDD0|nr:AzlD domain-containing protein [Amylibacter sp. SFDW26]